VAKERARDGVSSMGRCTIDLAGTVSERLGCFDLIFSAIFHS
jgi:hypothetical protein